MGQRSTPLRTAVVLLALLVLGGSQPVSAALPTSVRVEDGLRIAIDSMRQLATDSRNNKKNKRTTKPKPGLPIDLGKDGRLTMLLMGSDWRPEAGGERLDVIIVATIDPLTGKAAMVSIPRDMAAIPLAGGGTSGSMRVNSIYYLRYRKSNLKHGRIDRKGLTRFSRDIAKFLGTEIDYWAFVRFGTFASLINSLGGIRVDVDDEVLDPSYHHGRSRGVWFPRRDGYRLLGDPKCKPKPKKCRSALVYARSRKGTHGGRANSDFQRSERQQELIFAAVRQIVDEQGAGLRMLGTMLNARKHVETNLPTTAEAAAQLFAIVHRVSLPRSNMRVLAPGPFASMGASFAIVPNVGAIRRWVDKKFYTVKPPRRRDGPATASTEDAGGG